MTVKITPNIPDPDLFYRELAALHEDKTAEESLQINTKLVLILANQIGDMSILLEIIDRVRQQTE